MGETHPGPRGRLDGRVVPGGTASRKSEARALADGSEFRPTKELVAHGLQSWLKKILKKFLKIFFYRKTFFLTRGTSVKKNFLR